MKPFRERNPLIIGAVSLGLIVLILLAAFRIDDLPLIGGGTAYSAAFTDASGLVPTNEVRVAGVKVGKVTAVDLDRDHVKVEFKVDSGVALGTKTAATIRIKTVLGQKFLALEPDGPGRMEEDDEIPISRTASPFDVVQAVNGLAETADQIDVQQLAQAFDTLSTTFADTPVHVRSSLEGLSRLSRTVASRDDALRQLLARARGVTQVLADRNEEFTKLIADGNLLLDEVSKRRDAIHELLVATSDLARQLSGLVVDNNKQLLPALQQLRAVVATLQRNRTNLEATITNLSPFIKAFANVLGNGRWFDSYLCGLLQPYLPGAPPAQPAGGDKPGAASGGKRSSAGGTLDPSCTAGTSASGGR